MAAPTWSVGQVLTASDVNTWFVPVAATKTADQSVTSSTVLVNDSELLVPVAANATYAFDAWLDFIALAGADIKWTWTVPAGTGLTYSAQHNEGGGTGYNNSQVVYVNSDTVPAAGASPTVTAATMRGTLVTGSSSGTLQLKWAQGASSASATHVRSPSSLELRRIG